MGCRLRIGKISKKAYDKYKDMESEKEVRKAARLKKNNCIYTDLPEFMELYELGKYVDYSDGTIPFFKFELEDVEFQIASKDWLMHLIEVYRIKIRDWYELLSKAIIESHKETENNNSTEDRIERLSIYKGIDTSKIVDVSPALELYSHIQSRKRLWQGRYVQPYRIDRDFRLTDDWSYEYSIFNLLHILKTFNWKKDLLIYSGW